MKRKWGTFAGPVPFVTTQWSVVAVAGGHRTTETAQWALASLYRDYWAPIYSFVRRQGYGAADAQDLTQDFFIYLVEHEAYGKAESSKGRFRSFLLGWLKNFLGTVQHHESRVKRGGNQRFIFLDSDLDVLEQLGSEELLVSAPQDEERLFDMLWAGTLVRRAMKTLEAEHATEPKRRIFRALKPFLQGGVDLPSQGEAAARLGTSVETLRSHLSRLRARYRAILREEVTRTVAEASEVDEELRYLGRVLIAASPEGER